MDGSPQRSSGRQASRKMGLWGQPGAPETMHEAAGQQWMFNAFNPGLMEGRGPESTPHPHTYHPCKPNPASFCPCYPAGLRYSYKMTLSRGAAAGLAAALVVLVVLLHTPGEPSAMGAGQSNKIDLVYKVS